MRPDVVQVRLYVEDGRLTGDITCRGIFSERIVGTVQSGLPAVVELFYHLLGSIEGTVKKGVHSYSLAYDVWEDGYSISGGDSTVYFPTFKEMRATIEHLRSVSIIPFDEILPEQSYRILVSVAVNPLQGTDNSRIAGWVSENVRGNRDDSWHEQVLNLNDLITHFFSKEKDTTNRSGWFRSEPFKPGHLPVRNKEAE